MVASLFLAMLSAILPNDMMYEEQNRTYTKNELLSEVRLVTCDPPPPTIIQRPAAEEIANGYRGLFNDPQEEWPDDAGVSNWRKVADQSANVADLSNAIPIEMGAVGGFTTTEILEGLANSSKKDITSYGGCGPIATMGIIDYFTRSAGFAGLMGDPDNHISKVRMAEEVFNDSPIIPLDSFVGHDATGELPHGVRNAFNTYVTSRNLNLSLEANEKHTVLGGKGSAFWKDIVSHVNQGLPVTLCTGCFLENGVSELQHIVNVYGYETWRGIKDKQTIEKKYLKVRLNWGKQEEQYFDAAILNYYMVGIVTYDIKQYPFDVSVTSKQLSNGLPTNPSIMSNWKPVDVPPLFSGWLEYRNVCASENGDIVLSPMQEQSGSLSNLTSSYLELGFGHDIQKLEFEVCGEYAGIGRLAPLEVDCTCIDSDEDEPQISLFKHRRIPLLEMPAANSGTKKYTLMLPRLTRRVKLSLGARARIPKDEHRVYLRSFRVCYL